MKKRSGTKKQKKTTTDGAVYYSGRVPERYRYRIPPNYIWNDASFQMMAHELLQLRASIQPIGYYIQRMGARYLVPKKSPIVVRRKSPIVYQQKASPSLMKAMNIMRQRSPIKRPVARMMMQSSPGFMKATNDYLAFAKARKSRQLERKNK
jgi:hypothetical protein